MDDEAMAWLRRVIEGDKVTAEAAPGPAWTADEDGCCVLAGDSGVVAETVSHDLGEREQVVRHAILHDPLDVLARCEAELAILDFRALAEVVTTASDDGETGERSEARQAKRRLAVLDIVVGHLASGYRHRLGYAEHWGEGCPVRR
jgi:Family of unknown function (DUF6221)